MSRNHINRLNIPGLFFQLFLVVVSTTLSMKAIAAPGIVTPANNSTLLSNSQTFTWAEDESVERWWL